MPSPSINTPLADIREAAVLGAGTMGRGIATSLVNTGIAVTVIDPEATALETARTAIADIFTASVKRGKVTADESKSRQQQISYDTGDDALKTADVIIEAVYENRDLKQKLFKKMDRLGKPGCILASNTSSLSIDDLADVTRHPQNVLGLHFFSPAHIMKLLEIVRGKKTSADTIQRARALGERIGKIPVVVGNCPGFTGNRMYHKYNAQAFHLLEEGAAPEQIDGALKKFGFAMGPLAVGDLSGLDIGWNIRKEKAKLEGIDADAPIVPDMICEAGRFGQKTGKGWYQYHGGDRTPVPDPDAMAIIMAASEKRGIRRREITDKEITERCVFALINEGARLLDEGMVENTADIDTVWTAGYGFPKDKTGPMHYGESIGLNHVTERLQHYYNNGATALKPAPLLEKPVAGGQTFSDLTEHKRKHR